MNTATKTALLSFLVAGCAVQLSPELQLTNFSKDPDIVNVTGVPGVVTCEMTIPDGAGGAGGGSPNVVKYAACSFKSPDGRKQGCLATSEALDVWSCDVTIPADSEGSASPGTTWTIEYVFAESEDGAKLFATGAEIEADQVDGEVDLKVISDAADTTPPTITTWSSTSLDVFPGSPIQCRVQTDEDPVALIGCTFLPDDASASISCISSGGSDTCTTTVPETVAVGVIYNEVNHFARDAALNVTVANGANTFTVVAPPTTGTISVDMTGLPAQCTGAGWVVNPGGLTGTASAGGFEVAPGDYTITWQDSALGCTVPSSSPQIKAVTVGAATTFDFTTSPSTNYTTRSTFASVNTDVGVDGNYGAAPPGGGPWTIAWDLLPFQFAASGTGDVTGVVPSQGDFYVGRNYTLTWGAETDHTTPAANAITTSGTYQGNYIDLLGGGCDSKVAELSASSGTWDASGAQAPANALLTFEAYVKAASLNALVTISNNPATTFGDSPMLVRFSSDGFFEAWDGEIDDYGSINSIAATLGVWHKITFTANIQTGTYSVDIGTCDESQTRLITDATYRSAAPLTGGLDYYNVWSETGTVELELSEWTAGACTPDVCTGSPPLECGTPDDGCGTPLACGDTCTGGDVCFPEGTCCTPSATVCTDPDPDYVCGDWSDGCGGTVNCGSCTGGDFCNGAGQCVEPAGAYVHVTPADVGVTIGVGVVSPVPTTVYTGPLTLNDGNLAQAVIDGDATGSGTVGDPWVIENVIINSGTNGLLFRTSNIVIRNVSLVDASFRSLYVGFPDDPDIDNIVIEYSRLENTSSNKVFNVNDATNLVVRYNEIVGGQDFYFMNRTLDGFISEYNYHHSTIGSAAAHSDGWHVGDFGVTTGTIIMRGNYLDPNNDTIGKTDILWAPSGPNDGNHVMVLMENNFFFPWGLNTLRCQFADQCNVRNNIYHQDFKTLLPNDPNIQGAVSYRDESAATSVYECNRYEDGSFIEDAYVKHDAIEVTNKITGCPGYP